jgi:glycosyltransferase involved in cell wall biosynthesis
MNSDAVACAFVGAFALPGDNSNNPAYSQAGHLLQERLLTSLADTGIDVTSVFSLRTVASFPVDKRLWYRTARSRVADRFAATLIPFCNLGVLKTLSGGLSLFPHLLRWAWTNRHRRRAILLYNVSSPPGVVSVLAGRLTNSAVFAVVADINVPGAGLVPDTLLRRLDYRLQTRSLPLFDGLIVLTRRMARDFAPETPHIQVEGGIPSAPATPRDAPARVGAADGAGRAEPFILMYSGGLAELKGVPLLLSAFARLQGEHFRLWIAGNGPLRPEVEDAARRDPRIEYLGVVPNDRVLELYEQVTVLVNPHSTTHLSARYLFPSKLIEYLATGRPVISTCSTPEVREEYGCVTFLLQEEDPAELAGLIQRLAAMPRPELAAVGERGREFVLRHKTWDVQGRRIATFMRETIAARPKRRLSGAADGAPGRIGAAAAGEISTSIEREDL